MAGTSSHLARVTPEGENKEPSFKDSFLERRIAFPETCVRFSVTFPGQNRGMCVHSNTEP